MRAGDLVLDLGAGTGALTAHLLDAGARVVAVELHQHRASALRERYADQPVKVVRCDLGDLRLPRRPFRVVSTPPYQLSSTVVRMLLGTDRLLSAELVLQRGAVNRFVARPPAARHSRHYRLEMGLSVPRKAFAPPPSVDSAVLRILRL